MQPNDSAALERRRRARNVIIFVALLGLVALFYFVSIARMSH